MVWYSSQASTERYCRHMMRTAPARMLLDQSLLMPDATHPTRGLSPDPAAADSLFTFLAQRFVASYDILGCADRLHLPDPVSVVADSQGVVNGATIDNAGYNRCRRSLSASEVQDTAADDAGKASALTE
jgi:hypothetical protein